MGLGLQLGTKELGLVQLLRRDVAEVYTQQVPYSIFVLCIF